MDRKYLAVLAAAAATLAGTVFLFVRQAELAERRDALAPATGQHATRAPTAGRSTPPTAGQRHLPDASSASDASSELRQVPPHYAYLPTEQAFMVDGATNLDAMQVALHQKDFSKVVESFGSDTGKDPSAQDLTQLYHRLIAEQVRDSGARLAITGFACGLSICAGSMRYERQSDAFEGWVGVFFADRRTPSYNFVDSFVPLNPDESEGRFFFSIDPTLREVRGRR